MKRFSLLSVAFVLATACTDEPVEKRVATAPKSPRLTMSSLPSNASTVCVASVRARDELLAGETGPAADRQHKVDVLSAVIDDTCF